MVFIEQFIPFFLTANGMQLFSLSEKGSFTKDINIQSSVFIQW